MKNFALNSGERQFATSLEMIRKDHIERYQLAIDWLTANGMTQPKILDVFCGNGYGTNMLSNAFPNSVVFGIDGSEEAIVCANQYYKTNNNSFDARIFPFEFEPGETFDAIISLESIEHVSDDRLFLKLLTQHFHHKGYLILSVPNQHLLALEMISNPFHCRHYTNTELEDLFTSTGLTVVKQFGQHVYKQNDRYEIISLLNESEMNVIENLEGQFKIFILQRNV